MHERHHSLHFGSPPMLYVENMLITNFIQSARLRETVMFWAQVDILKFGKKESRQKRSIISYTNRKSAKNINRILQHSFLLATWLYFQNAVVSDLTEIVNQSRLLPLTKLKKYWSREVFQYISTCKQTAKQVHEQARNQGELSNPQFSKACLVVWYNNKLQSFFLPRKKYNKR